MLFDVASYISNYQILKSAIKMLLCYRDGSGCWQIIHKFVTSAAVCTSTVWVKLSVRYFVMLDAGASTPLTGGGKCLLEKVGGK